MCGRYYIENTTAHELGQMVRQLTRGKGRDPGCILERMEAGDVCPGREALVLRAEGGNLVWGWQRWGFSGFRDKKLVINARCESVMEKPMFRDSIRCRRVVIPAAGFYEWNAGREKSSFYRKDAPVLFLAGLGRWQEDGEHFVILTTRANESMKPVHDRMPLVLDQKEVLEWMLEDAGTKRLLGKTPCLLERKTDYEQMCLF